MFTFHKSKKSFPSKARSTASHFGFSPEKFEKGVGHGHEKTFFSLSLQFGPVASVVAFFFFFVTPVAAAIFFLSGALS